MALPHSIRWRGKTEIFYKTSSRLLSLSFELTALTKSQLSERLFEKPYILASRGRVSLTIGQCFSFVRDGGSMLVKLTTRNVAGAEKWPQVGTCIPFLSSRSAERMSDSKGTQSDTFLLCAHRRWTVALFGWRSGLRMCWFSFTEVILSLRIS